MPILQHDEIRIFEAPLGRIVGLASPSTGPSSEIVMFRAILPPGGETTPQVHDREEIIHVLSGRGVMRVGGDEREIGVGDVVVVPPGTVHAGRCTGDEDWDVVIAMPVGTAYTNEDGSPNTPPPWMF